LAWTGHYPGESMMEFQRHVLTSTTLIEFKDKMKLIKKWQGVAMNFVLADNSGNIGYMLTTSIPERKNDFPLLGCRVLDGTTAKYDWTGLGDFS